MGGLRKRILGAGLEADKAVDGQPELKGYPDR